MKQQRSGKKGRIISKELPFECVALVLQGGGALGSYQAGVYEALAEAGILPNWLAGISIGAINAGIIAGNNPKDRVHMLRGFWEAVTEKTWFDWTQDHGYLAPKGNFARSVFNRLSANFALFNGATHFFKPRIPAPFFEPDGCIEATSFYDPCDLKTTLERFIDFDRLNSGEVRFSVGAVNIRTGNFVYFDNNEITIVPEHIIASGSLPPGFPPTEIDGEFYWDGGLVSNTPLQWVVDGNTRQDTLAFQVDLWNARGDVPCNLSQVTTRQKEIQYSSRTRAATNNFKRVQIVRNALSDFLENVPKDLRTGPDYDLLKSVADKKVYNIVHLIYRARQYEGHSKDYEFSRLSMRDHWQSGYNDVVHTLRHECVLKRPENKEGVFVFDFASDGAY